MKFFRQFKFGSDGMRHFMQLTIVHFLLKCITVSFIWHYTQFFPYKGGLGVNIIENAKT